MKDFKFANGLLFSGRSGSETYEQRPNYSDLMGKEPILLWMYLSQKFV